MGWEECWEMVVGEEEGGETLVRMQTQTIKEINAKSHFTLPSDPPLHYIVHIFPCT